MEAALSGPKVYESQNRLGPKQFGVRRGFYSEDRGTKVERAIRTLSQRRDDAKGEIDEGTRCDDQHREVLLA